MRSAATSNFSPAICWKAGRPRRAATTSPPPTSRRSSARPASHRPATTTRTCKQCRWSKRRRCCPAPSAKLVRDDETYAFEYGTHYLPSADFLSASSTLTAPLVFAGYGVDAPELGYTDFDERRPQRSHRRDPQRRAGEVSAARSAPTTRGASASGARSSSAARSARSPSPRRSTRSACRGSAWSR